MLVENIAKLDRSKRNATMASLIVIAAFAIYNWTVTPHVANLSSAKTYESVINDLAKESKIISTKVRIKRKELDGLSDKSEQVLSLLFTPNQAREFFSDLEVISEQTGCSVHGVNLISNEPNSEDKHLGIRIVSAELNVVGLYKDISKLIRRLQARSQKVWLDSVELQTVGHNSDKVGCRLIITICQIVDDNTS